MPNTYSISNLLEIKDLIVDDFLPSYTDIHLYFHLEQRYVSCPFCNSITNKVHDYRPFVIKDTPIQDKFLFLHYKKRRYHCNNCNHHYFNEPFNLLHKYCRITNRLCFLSVHQLREPYYPKALFYEFMISENSSVAKIRLKKFISYAKVSRLSEFNATLTMLGNWSKFILNAFDFPYSNGFTEGCNNKIKVITRNGYRFRNFKNFRNRILLSMS